ncbi:MAG: AMP-dependent synthetase/ligase [Spirochaetota bacterium]
MITDYFADRPDMDYPSFNTLLRDVCARYPENVALRMQVDDGFAEVSYRDLGLRVEAYGRALEESGIAAGDHVGLLAENRAEWCVAYLAAVTRGVVIVPFDILSSDETLEAYGRYADLKAILFSEHFEERAAAIAAASRGCKILLHFDALSPEHRPSPVARVAGARTVDLRERFGSADAPLKAVEIAPDHPCSIIFTSGTTGSPKGVTLSHHGIIANINASIMSLPIDEHDNFVTVLPLHHTYPTTCSFLSPISVGGSVTIVSKIVGPKIIQATKETGGTILIGVPLLFDKLRRGIHAKLREQPVGKRALIATMRGVSRAGTAFGLRLGRPLFRGLREAAGLSSLRLLVSGGGPLSPDSASFFAELGFTIVQGYGMSENGPLITTNTIRHQDNRSAGLPVKRTEIRIADPDEHGVGEIQVKSPSLMLGYYKNAEATEEIFTPDGFLRTGDLGCFDSRGYLFIRGRSKNLIVSPAGKNIFPEEIEVKFPEEGPVAEVLVLGQRVAKGNDGERVVAVCYPDYERIELDRGTRPAEAEIRALVEAQVAEVNKSLEPYKRIERVYLRDEEFEKTASGKIKRFLYREYAAPEAP